jgi:hypothetical protein
LLRFSFFILFFAPALKTPKNPVKSRVCGFYTAENTRCCGVHKVLLFSIRGSHKTAQKNSRKAFEAQKKRLIAGGFVSEKAFANPIETEACEVLCPTFRGYCTGNDRIFLLGEAAGFISASSFEGISYALLSGEALAKAIHTARPAKTYHALTAKLRLKAREKSIKRNILASDMLRSMIMRSGITSIKSR